MAVTKRILDALTENGCQAPDCDCNSSNEPLYIHCRLHPAGEIEVSYFNGAITVGCKECSEAIISIAVAEEREKMNEP